LDVYTHVGHELSNRTVHTYIYAYSLTDPLSAQVGMNVEFAVKRAKLQYAIKSNK